ncbi:MAG: hypothetical protein ACTHM1_00870 [Solirubrobacteraceae bacterium]
MGKKFTIPAGLVRSVRLGLHTELGTAADEIETVSVERGRHEHPEWYEKPLAKLDATRALLDVVGWGEPEQAAEVDIDLDEHREALLAALTEQTTLHRELVEEADQVDVERAEKGKPPKAQATRARAAALDRLYARVTLALADVGEGGEEQVAPPPPVEYR